MAFSLSSKPHSNRLVTFWALLSFGIAASLFSTSNAETGSDHGPGGGTTRQATFSMY